MEISIPLWLALLASLILGGLIGFLAGYLALRKSRFDSERYLLDRIFRQANTISNLSLQIDDKIPR